MVYDVPEVLSIRDATNRDASVIAHIYNESIAAKDSTLDEESKTAEEIQGWIAGFNGREALLVLEDSRLMNAPRVIGWGLIKRYTERTGYRFCCETAVYLRRSMVRRGYGSLLKQAIIERCRQYKYHHLHAKIFTENIASIEYNKRFGYEIVGIQKEIGYQEGRWKDVTIMQLILTDVET